MNGKSRSFPLMTDITSSRLPFMNGIYRDFLEKSYLANPGYHPVPSHSIPVICSRMAISLMIDRHCKMPS